MNMQSKKREWKEGFIVMLDALGVKSRNIDETNDFLDKYGVIRNRLPYAVKQIQSLKIALMQDTIIYCFVYDNQSPSVLDDHPIKLRDLLYIIGAHLFHFVQFAFENGLAFRGVISKGAFIIDDTVSESSEISSNIVVGPAIYDAASWYEESNWIGIMTTPQLSLLIDKWIVSVGPASFEAVFRKYDVPLKNSIAQQVWCLNWPCSYWTEKPKYQDVIPEYNIIEGDKKFMDDFERMKKSSSDAIKYVNTLAYYNYIKKIYLSM